MKKFFLIMGIIIVIGAVIMVYLFLNQYKKLDQLTIMEAPEFTSIPFRYAPGGHIIIDVKIDNSGTTYPFVLDTGAPNYLFHNFPEDKIGNTIGRAVNSDTNGQLFFPKIYNIPLLEFGDIHLKDIAFSKSSAKFSCTQSMYGIIGKNTMRHFVWQFDFENKIIHIAKEAKLLPYDSRKSSKIKLGINKFSHHLYVPIHIGNAIKTKVILDTGLSGFFSLSPKIVDQLGAIKKINILGEGSRGLGGKSDSKQYFVNIDSLSVGKEKNLSLDTVTIKTSEKSSFKGVGMEFLKNFMVTIDWKNKILTLSQQRKKLDLQKKGFGFDLGFENGQAYIKSVIEGTKAYKLGLQPNMKNFLINEKTIQTASEFCAFQENKKSLDSITITFPKSGEVYALSKEYYQ